MMLDDHVNIFRSYVGRGMYESLKYWKQFLRGVLARVKYYMVSTQIAIWISLGIWQTLLSVERNRAWQ